MPKESIIKHYSSSTTGSVPSAADLVQGELAINTADERIYFENASGQVVNFGESKGISATYARRSSVVSSLNGLTGALTITGTANEIEVTTTTPNIVVGLRDSVTIDNLIVTQDITATRFSGSLVGRVSNAAKNTESYTLTAGTPVYISGYVGGGASGILEVKAAAANNSSTMPAVGLIETTLAANGEGRVVTFGLLGGLNTNGFVAGQTLFIAPSGGLTATRPTSGSHLVQNIGRVANISTNQGEIIVLGPGRSNDVPNNITVRGFLEMPNGQTATSIVTTVNGLSGSVTLTGDGGAIVGVSNNTIGARLATASLTGVASFPATDFAVSPVGAVTLTGNVAKTNVAQTFTGLQRFTTGISAAGMTTSSLVVTGTSSFLGTAAFVNPFGVSLSAGNSVISSIRTAEIITPGNDLAVKTFASPGIASLSLSSTDGLFGDYTYKITPSVATTNQNFTLPNDSGIFALTKNIVSSFNGVTGTVVYAPPLASASATGVASFSSTDFSVSAAGLVSIQGGLFTIRDETGAVDTIAKGETFTITGGSGIDFIRTSKGNFAIRGVTATSSNLGVASFPATDFAVSDAGAVSVTGNFVRTVVVGGSTLTGNVSLTAGSNITLTPSGNTITIASTASGGGGGVTTTAQNTWTATQYFNAGLSATGATFTGNQTVSGSLTVTNGITFGSGTTFWAFIPDSAVNGGGVWQRQGIFQIGASIFNDIGAASFIINPSTETHGLYGNFRITTDQAYQAAQNTLTLNTSSSHTGRPLRISRGTGNFIAGCEPNGTWFGTGIQETTFLGGLTFSANPIRMAGLGIDWSFIDSMAGAFVTVTPTTGGGNKPTQITFDDMKVIADDGLAIGAGAINAQTAGYTLVAGDNGKVITINSASAITLTAGTAVGTTGFSCSVIQLGAGQVTIAGSGVTLNSFSGLKIAGQHGAASIVCYATNTLNVAGNLTT